MIYLANIQDKVFKGKACYVGRSFASAPDGCEDFSELGNPYTHLPLKNTKAEFQVKTLSEAIQQYRKWLEGKLQTGGQKYRDLLNRLYLYAKQGDLTLVCHCHPEPCHAQVIRKRILDSFKYDLREIKPIAEQYQQLLSPYCEKISIAGSIRRECPKIGDIELIAIAKQKEESISMFEKKSVYVPELIQLVNNWEKSIGKFETATRYTQRIIPELHGVKLDLFIVQAHDFGRQLAIRTGPADYSHQLAQEWVKLGYKGTEQGLEWVEPRFKNLHGEYLPDKSITFLRNPYICHLPTEEMFFRQIGIKYVEPRNRV